MHSCVLCEARVQLRLGFPKLRSQYRVDLFHKHASLNQMQPSEVIEPPKVSFEMKPSVSVVC